MASLASIAQNIDAVQPNVGRIGSAAFTTGNTTKTGVSATNLLTAGANGSKVDSVSALPLGTNVPSVLRVFYNTGAAKFLLAEASLPETMLTEIAQQNPVVIQLNLMLPSGHSIEATIGTTVAAGWQVTCRGGDY
jgi:hypothetical protein